MAKQEYKILNFEGGTNNKYDPRDIAENQNTYSQFSVNKVGRLVKEGDAKNLYDKTNLNNHTITNVTTDSGGFERSYGLHIFTHDFDMDSPPDEVSTEFICINDANGIDIYDPNKSGGADFRDNHFTLGSRTATVKPKYYNVDGGLRTCDSNFDITDTTETVDMTGDVSITKDDREIIHTSGTIPAESVIQIDQEIMYVTATDGSTTIRVIRGFANTKISTHAHDSKIYFVNVPKYFGHIKADRLFECEKSNSINTWTEDVQTPQPPNNTRKGGSTTGALASSAGIQSLRVYDEISSSTSNYPAESEKVVLEFGESAPDYGITQVTVNADSDVITLRTSVVHGLSEGDEIVISNISSDSPTNLSGLAGTHVVSNISDNGIKFDITIEDHSISASVDWFAIANYSTISAWADYSETVGGAVKATLTDAEANDGTYYVHITDITGMDSFNGVKRVTSIDNSNFYFKDTNHSLDLSGVSTGGTTRAQELLATITRPDEDAMDEDLKRKWNFAMSFTYDGPGQEVQESLLTQGYKITESTQADGLTANLLGDNIGNTTDSTNIDVDDASVFTVNTSVIMIGAEQMLVTGVDTSVTPNHINVTRGYNNSTAATQSNNAPIMLVEELSPSATVDWTSFTVAPKCVIKSVYNYGVSDKSWNPRINGFKIYMKDVTEDDASKEFRLFSEVNFNKGRYTIFAAGDSELILEQPATGSIATDTSGTHVSVKPVDTYLSENLFTEQTIIDAQYRASCVAGRKVYIGNIRQGGRTYPDRMLRSPVNKFDTFPETNFIDVAVGDGDEIIALESFGDRLLQYKKKTLYVINISGKSEVLESEYPDAGVSMSSQVVKTNAGIVWVNGQGLWVFDGQRVVNVLRQSHDGGYAVGIPVIGFDNKTNRVIYTPLTSAGILTRWYIYDLELQAYQSFYDGTLFPHSKSGGNYYTNIVNDSDGNMIVGYADGASNTTMNFFKWDSSPGEGLSGTSLDLWKSKDIDFGSPSVNKKIHKVYVTYKCEGHSNVEIKYATDGSGDFSGTFSSSKSTNYNADSFTGQGTRTGFKKSDGAWKVAELIPSSSINNVKSIQLSLSNITIQSGTARAGSATSMQLKDDASTSETNSAYNDYHIYIDNGPGRYNASRITEYVGSLETVTFDTLTDKGYGNSVTNASEYLLGTVATDFEINDITIIFRAKRVK